MPGFRPQNVSASVGWRYTSRDLLSALRQSPETAFPMACASAFWLAKRPAVVTAASAPSVIAAANLLNFMEGPSRYTVRGRNRTRKVRRGDLAFCRSGAGDGNRTHVSSLGSYSSTIELHPQLRPRE